VTAADAFDPSLVAKYASNNASGFSLLTIAYLVDRGLSVEDWAVWLGGHFAGPQTNWRPGMGAGEMAHEAALEMVSMKARLLSVSGDDARSEVRLEWPAREDLAELGLRREHIQEFWTAWQPIAASVGLRFAVALDQDGVTTLRFFKNG